MLRISLFDILRKIPAVKRKEAELEEKDQEVRWTVRRFDDLDERHKEVVRSNGFAGAFIYDHSTQKEGKQYAR
ncbi:hypothetical protein [Paenibacillus sp. FSL R7-0331]|uniref:hypothetical protein n=1 Tax=Paenibacillus sp. FSL R7-0331 TaxID=1536773 RepID=UPI0004F664DD|nr:hypothetical protein [Paenibacillus sp. FSL R7-0331]AIQ54560.1 hypothetical protein R70331_25635 [Paenibacillus sp. FSL R7-0331]